MLNAISRGNDLAAVSFESSVWRIETYNNGKLCLKHGVQYKII